MHALVVTVWLILFTTLLAVLVRYGSPILLRAFFPRLVVSSISPRSVRGLRWRRGPLQVSVERIGFGLRRPSAERTSWLSMQVEGFEVKILHLDVRGRGIHPVSPGLERPKEQLEEEQGRHLQNSSLVRLLDADEEYAPPLAFLSFFLPTSAIRGIDHYLRPLFRAMLVSLLRQLFRALPSLTQLIQFEMDSARVIMDDLQGAGMAVKDVRVHTLLDFKEFEDVTDDDIFVTRQTSNNRAGGSRLKERMQSAMSRLWNRAWGNARGRASMTVSVGTISVFLGNSSPPLSPVMTPAASPGPWPNSPSLYTPATASTCHSGLTSSFSTAFTLDTPRSATPTVENPPSSGLPPEIVFLISEGTSVRMGLQLEPRKSNIIKDGSVDVDLDLPSTAVSLRAATTLMKLAKKLQQSIRPTHSNRAAPEAERSYDTSLPGPPESVSSAASIRSFMRLAQSGRTQQPQTASSTRANMAQMIVNVVNHFSWRLRSLDVALDIWPPAEHESGALSWTVCNLDMRLEHSDPTRSDLHRSWLGRRNIGLSSSDLTALAVEIAVESFALDRASLRPIHRGPTTILTAGRFTLHGLTTWIPPGFRSAPNQLQVDENSALVICSVMVEQVDLKDRLDAIQHTLRLLVPPKTTVPSEPSTHFYNLPRVIAAVEVKNIGLNIVLPTPRSYKELPSSLNFHTAGISVHMQTSYVDLCTSSRRFDPGKAYWGGEDGRRLSAGEPYTLRYQFETACSAEPLSARICYVSADKFDEDGEGSEDNSQPTSPPLEAEEHDVNLFSLTGLEGIARGHILGNNSFTAETSLDLHSTMADARCTIEDITVEVWRPRVLHALALLGTFNLTPEVDPHPVVPSLLDRLPAGVFVYVSVCSFTALVAGEEPVPGRNFTTSKGIALRLGFVIQYCYYQSLRHTIRAKKRLGHNLARQRLSLPEDMSVQSAAFATDTTHADERAALLSLAGWNASCRTILNAATDAPRYAAESLPAMFFKPRDKLMCFVPQSVARVLLRRQRSTTLAANFSDTCEISVEAPSISGELKLPNIFCSLLAWKSLETISMAFSRSRRVPRVANSRPMLICELRANIDTVHIDTSLSLKQRLHLQLTRLALEWASDGTYAARWGIAYVWIPSPAVEGRWEEMLRLREWSAMIPSTETQAVASLQVSGKAARLYIPYKYVLSNLITDINVSLKAARHLVSCLEAGTFISPPPPSPATARRMPHIRLRLDVLTLAAEDDPFESRLNLILKAGYQEQLARLERQMAFEAKAEAIRTAAYGPSIAQTSSTGPTFDWHFSERHTVSTDDAYARLQQYNSLSWVKKFRAAKNEQDRREEDVYRAIYGSPLHQPPHNLPIKIHAPDRATPLFRVIFNGFDISLSEPSFPLSETSTFLEDLGKGVSRDQQYTLLVPLHLVWNMSRARIALRDYPLPLAHVPSNDADKEPAWSMTTDLVIAEQTGPLTSLHWITAEIMPDEPWEGGLPGLSFSIPRTCMPVKTFAEPRIRIATGKVTELAWGVSYNPVIQDVMRVIESITSPPKDPSPSLAFWDKLRLIFHWRIKCSFPRGGVHFHIKGSRDPYSVSDIGAGFALCWQGSPSIHVGYGKEMELIQVQSERMSFVIPNLSHLDGGNDPIQDLNVAASGTEGRNTYRKVCAKFTNGVRWGIGFKLERTCTAADCHKCNGSIYLRHCRYFDFHPHHTVTLQGPPSGAPPPEGWPDSYAGFRSDFIHMSLSLTSSTRDTVIQDAGDANSNGLTGYNSFHLTPKGFAHFWAWWELFRGPMSVPIRQGKLFPNSRPPSKKFGRHLATLKYRFSLAPLVISHVYKQDSKSEWAKGQTRTVGLKAMIDRFQADMHQRDQEVITFHEKLHLTKRTRHKVFYVADVEASGVDLRAMAAIFAEPEKSLIAEGLDMDTESEASLPTSACDDLDPGWFDLDDFVDTDWSPTDSKPKLTLLQAGACPRFSFFKHTTVRQLSRRGLEVPTTGEVEVTKFGDEDTHVCLAGRHDGVYEVQIRLAKHRLGEVEGEPESTTGSTDDDERVVVTESNSGPGEAAGLYINRKAAREMKIGLLRDYIKQLTQAQDRAKMSGELGQCFFDDDPAFVQSHSTHSADIVTSSEWMGFDNVYEAHSPTIFLSNDTRNVMLDYYYSSRMHRGLEYHMTERAIKFIRDHAKPVDSQLLESDNLAPAPSPLPAHSQSAATHANRVQEAAQGLFRLFAHDDKNPVIEETAKVPALDDRDMFEDPHSGWSDDVTVRKSHFVVLLKPQIVLRSDLDRDSILVLAIRAVHIRNYSVLDNEHIEDPINGRIMQRNYVSLNGLQTFYPTRENASSMGSKHNSLPLEVLLDVRCETRDFDRLVPHSSVKIQYDKFNQLRLRKKMRTYSGPPNSMSKRNEHLRHNMDRIMVNIPQFSVAADARHYGAIYNTVTDLLLYRDPAQKARSQRLETFLYSYDFTDLLSAAHVVSRLQNRMRQLMQLEKTYSVRLLDEEGQHDHLAIKAEMQNLAEELGLIFDAIKLKQDKTGNRQEDDQNSALRLEIWVSEISWRMLDPRHALLAKLSAKGIVFSWFNRKDGSAANTLDIEDLQALNSTPDALFSEMLVKYEKPANHPMVKMSKFALASWGVLAPVAGISIIQSFQLQLHPVRLQIERRIGRQIMDYVFARRQTRKESVYVGSSSSQASDSSVASGVNTSSGANGHFTSHGPNLADSRRPTEDETRPPSWQRPRLLAARSSSMTDVRAAVGDVRHKSLSRMVSSDVLRPRPPTENKDAAEMRSRAAQNRTFLSIHVASSVFVLSYKGDKPKSITDLYDFRFQVPSFQYRNQTWSFEELVQQLKRDIIKSAWQQKGALFREVVTKTRRPQHLLRPDVKYKAHRSGSSDSARTVDSNSDFLGEATSKKGQKGQKGRLWPLLLRKDKKSPKKVNTGLSSSSADSGSSGPVSIFDDKIPLAASPTEDKPTWQYDDDQVDETGTFASRHDSDSSSSQLDFPSEESALGPKRSLDIPRDPLQGGEVRRRTVSEFY